MAKNKNKGFTLLEVMIAIAILTVLLVPIMRQFTQTLDTSRRAKELQYANEAAAYLLEYSQRNDLAKLASGSDATSEANELKLTAPANVQTQICNLYDSASGHAIGASGSYVRYKVYEYKINDVKLGARNTVYHRNVVLDDLAVQLGAKSAASGNGYKIAYDMTQADLSRFPSGFELTNEGSIVKYNSSGYIEAIACREADLVSNPNDTNLGNMQDLDATKVAIINGTASNFDAQAESLFFSKTMEKLKQTDPKSYEQAMLHTSNDSVLNTIDYVDSTNKITKIYIDFDTCGTADTSDDYYIVKADVYYLNDYSFKITGNQQINASDVIDYNVFSQKFYTDKCPDIYFEYQPYTADYAYGAANKVTYAANDYIMIDNFVTDAKIYLYKPTNDQNNVAYGTTTNGNAYYTTNTSGQKVKINIFKSTNQVECARIYTNLDVSIGGSNAQFATIATNVIPTVITDSHAHAGIRTNYDPDYIKPLADDKRTDNRLMTVTVKLTPESDSVSRITLTGAKGEN
ncbi:MAG: type II secretion system GspH family protein [Clostridium sp.]|nr:type II secretion system GspH family protein [Clostridium sp.]MCM1400228.1 type II secretion system GspH family protein [Clostridium sp.]MCM1460319.1 type II secretion system GspH family protein [Bacteroides sp.]